MTARTTVAQGRAGTRNRPLLLLLMLMLLASLAGSGTPARAAPAPIKLIVDADVGVDDAAAITWLFSQQSRPIQVLGFVAVAGNTSVEHAANNILTLLDAYNKQAIPVVIGASSPLSQTLTSTSKLLHGPDGLWFLGLQHPHDLSGLSRAASDFYCSKAAADVTILALGPLTNLARAHAQCPQAMRSARVIALGGAKFGGNRTPVAEFNIWQDPEAAEQVFNARLQLSLITYDAFNSLTFTQKDVDRLLQKGNPGARLVAGALQGYLTAQLGLAGRSAAALPDPVAAMYALDTTLGTPQSALVKVITGQSLARGQTVIGLSFGERLPMIASDAELSALVERAFSEPNFDLFGALIGILVRDPDNAQVVLDVNEKEIARRLMRDLTRN